MTLRPATIPAGYWQCPPPCGRLNYRDYSTCRDCRKPRPPTAGATEGPVSAPRAVLDTRTVPKRREGALPGIPGYPVTVRVDGAPVPKARARVCTTANGVSVSYTPQATKAYESRVRAAWQAQAGGLQPIPRGVPVAVTIIATFELPASAPKRDHARAVAGETWPMAQRPDLDNVVKAVLDALNSLAWFDDGQAAVLRASKRRGSKPMVSVTIDEVH